MNESTTTHTGCSADAHVHFRPAPVLLPYGHLVMLEHRPVAVCHSIAMADRIATLLAEHGPVAIPDRIPDSIMWGPPLLPALVDPRLPEDPTVTR